MQAKSRPGRWRGPLLAPPQTSGSTWPGVQPSPRPSPDSEPGRDCRAPLAQAVRKSESPLQNVLPTSVALLCGKAPPNPRFAPCRSRSRIRPARKKWRLAMRAAFFVRPTASSTRTLPLQSKSEANVPFPRRASHLHERAIGHIVVHTAAAVAETIAGGRPGEVRRVGQVVKLGAELQVQALPYGERSHDRHVGIPHPGLS